MKRVLIGSAVAVFLTVLAMIVAGRELTRDRLSAGRAAQREARSPSVPAASAFAPMVPNRA